MEMNLRGLVLTFRLLLGSKVPHQVLSLEWHIATFSVCSTVQFISPRLAETSPHKMGAAKGQSSAVSISICFSPPGISAQRSPRLLH
jgi:hypothetical protein